MKKILSIIVMGILICCSFGVRGYINEKSTIKIANSYLNDCECNNELIIHDSIEINYKLPSNVDIFNDDRDLVATRELKTGDILLMISGGHGFRMLEDTIFIEIKQGPYIGLNEKVRF